MDYPLAICLSHITVGFVQQKQCNHTLHNLKPASVTCIHVSLCATLDSYLKVYTLPRQGRISIIIIIIII